MKMKMKRNHQKRHLNPVSCVKLLKFKLFGELLITTSYPSESEASMASDESEGKDWSDLEAEAQRGRLNHFFY